MRTIKTKQTKCRKRFTPEEQTKIVAWLRERAKSQMPAKVTWREVEAFSGFSKMRLSQDSEVHSVYRATKSELRGTVPRRKKLPPHAVRLETRVKELSEKIEQLTEERNRWLLLWDRWQYNAHRKGWNVKELDRPLPPAVHRKIPRAGSN